jgi:hypothetical protein
MKKLIEDIEVPGLAEDVVGVAGDALAVAGDAMAVATDEVVATARRVGLRRFLILMLIALGVGVAVAAWRRSSAESDHT